MACSLDFANKPPRGEGFPTRATLLNQGVDQTTLRNPCSVRLTHG